MTEYEALRMLVDHRAKQLGMKRHGYLKSVGLNWYAMNHENKNITSEKLKSLCAAIGIKRSAFYKFIEDYEERYERNENQVGIAVDA